MIYGILVSGVSGQVANRTIAEKVAIEIFLHDRDMISTEKYVLSGSTYFHSYPSDPWGRTQHMQKVYAG